MLQAHCYILNCDSSHFSEASPELWNFNNYTTIYTVQLLVNFKVSDDLYDDILNTVQLLLGYNAV
jgi:hypothetical protein